MSSAIAKAYEQRFLALCSECSDTIVAEIVDMPRGSADPGYKVLQAALNGLIDMAAQTLAIPVFALSRDDEGHRKVVLEAISESLRLKISNTINEHLAAIAAEDAEAEAGMAQ